MKSLLHTAELLSQLNRFSQLKGLNRLSWSGSVGCAGLNEGKRGVTLFCCISHKADDVVEFS